MSRVCSSWREGPEVLNPMISKSNIVISLSELRELKEIGKWHHINVHSCRRGCFKLQVVFMRAHNHYSICRLIGTVSTEV